MRAGKKTFWEGVKFLCEAMKPFSRVEPYYLSDKRHADCCMGRQCSGDE